MTAAIAFPKQTRFDVEDHFCIAGTRALNHEKFVSLSTRWRFGRLHRQNSSKYCFGNIKQGCRLDIIFISSWRHAKTSCCSYQGISTSNWKCHIEFISWVLMRNDPHGDAVYAHWLITMHWYVNPMNYVFQPYRTNNTQHFMLKPKQTKSAFGGTSKKRARICLFTLDEASNLTNGHSQNSIHCCRGWGMEKQHHDTKQNRTCDCIDI